MAVVSLSTSPSTLDAGTSENVTVNNTGTVAATVTRGTYVRTLAPTQGVVVYPEGTAVTAVVASGTGQVTTSAVAKQLPNAADPAALAANAAFTGAFAPKVLAAGTATLSGGTIAVTNPLITSSSVVGYWRTTAGGTLGSLSLSLSAGTSFTVTSSSGTDTSTIYYEVVSY